MNVQVKALQNVKYNDTIVQKGTILSIPKEDLSLYRNLFISVQEADRKEKEESAKQQKKSTSEQHFEAKARMQEADRIVRETEALLWEKQAEEQNKLAKAAATRLRQEAGGVKS